MNFHLEDIARALFEEAGDALFLIEPKTGRVLDANPTAQKLSGFTLEELIGRKSTDLFRSETEGGVERMQDASKRTGTFHSQEGYLLRYRDAGTWIPVNLTVTRLHLETGPLGLITARDIRERHEAEARLKKAEAELRRVMGSVTDCLWSAEITAPRHWTYRYFSPVVEKITGRPASFFESLGRWLSIVHPDDRRKVERFLFQRKLFKPAEEREYRVICPDGSVRWVRDSVRVSRSAEDGTLRLDGVLSDITPRKRMERALRRSEERFRALVEMSSDVIGLLDTQGKITYASSSTTRILGYDLADFLGQFIIELVHPEDEPRARQLFADCLERPGQEVRSEYRMRHRDGSWRQMEASLNNRLRDPAVRAVVANYHDVTDRRRAEDELRHAQKMEAVGQLAGGIAHDFNNLLTAILGNISLLEENQQLTPAQREALTAIDVAATRASTLTQQLLGFSSQTVLQPRPVDMNRVVQEVVGMLKHVFDPRILIEVVADSTLWPVAADPTGMDQVLMNLCLNARDAMPEGGRLTLRTDNVVVDETLARGQMGARPGQFVRLRVEDTGQGISAEVLPHIFEPFFTTKGPGKGTGLGLAMVFGIVQQHQGWIVCESQPGQGARFDVYVPRDGGLSAPAPPPTESHAESGHETILLVDDEAIVRNLGRTLLQRQGYTVLLAEDGPEGIELYRQHHDDIALVILDLTMPRLSGQETLEHLRRINPSVGVLFSSGYSADRVADEQVLGFVGKPYRPQELATAVRTALDRARKRPQASASPGT